MYIGSWDGVTYIRYTELMSPKNASVNSSSALCPLAKPRALTFFWEKMDKFPGCGHISCLNALGWGRRKRADATPQGSWPSNSSAVFLLISEYNVQLFIRQQYMLVDSEYILYFFVFYF